ncbi:hypothetical protein GCM10027200_15880 [Lentzea nigeriaca]
MLGALSFTIPAAVRHATMARVVRVVEAGGNTRQVPVELGTQSCAYAAVRMDSTVRRRSRSAVPGESRPRNRASQEPGAVTPSSEIEPVAP